MNQPTLSIIALACAAGLAIATPVDATTPADSGATITLYRSDAPALYASQANGDVDSGYAVIREQRTLALKSGVQDITLGDLPDQLDAEALALGFPDGGAKVISQRLLLGQGGTAALTGLIGREVAVLGDNGEVIASGKLMRAGSAGLVVNTLLGSTLVRQYAAVRQNGGGDFPTGSTLRLRVDATRGGNAEAMLSYPTAGLGWRAAYVGTLQPGSACRMQFESRASIANRSGRDWNDARLTLIAGEPSFAKYSAPRPMMAMRAMANAAPSPMPEQAQLDNYRSYTLPAPVDLPDGSVSQVPLYATRTLGCERTNLVENGGAWQPPQPMLERSFNGGSNSTVTSTLKFTAFDSLPAGYLRVLTLDAHGTPQFIGEGRINDTPKGRDASITLGQAFDLRAQRERTAFHVDQAGRTLDEAFRITLTNAGNDARTVTVREHPNRWREWKLASSSQSPSKQTTDTLEWRVAVPAHGDTVLDYAVHYSWSAQQHPQE